MLKTLLPPARRRILGLLWGVCSLSEQAVAAGYQGVDTEMSFAACQARPVGYANASRVFSGGYGSGCIFTMEEQGGTNVNERIEITARRYMDPAEQRAMIEFVRESFQKLLEDGGPGLSVQPFGLCGGGLTVVSRSVPEHPSIIGFYACGPHLVFVNTKGPGSVGHYLSMAEAMQGLLGTTAKPRDLR